ncbi:helix-turn-helix domain-containing protein [Undibacterium sp. TS12]|uniref:helix-turn-helix domain-containing protein n=1 Tax=Undibacterium sp. TS12 TaxID=2908202 RepID=UPI001F4CDC5A|nr:helix-turn-helix domain-containing protein [Undibacterium sp. TS12]MCH8618152.1 helix-turn-helix domain-containing protein [Undibacterium sp. TS12]
MTPIVEFVVLKREQLGLNQCQLAHRLGVDPSYVNRMESGKKTPGNIKFLEELVKALELSHVEAEKFFRLARMSRHTIKMPIGAPPRAYQLMSNLADEISEFSETQYKVLETLLEHFKFEAQQLKRQNCQGESM